VEQARQLAEAKADEPWLREAPSHCLRQALRDLDRACKTHGTWKVKWRSARKSKSSFRIPDARRIAMERLNRRWGQVLLPKFGAVRFRWSRSLGGQLRNATVLKDAGKWYVSFCVEDGLAESVPNGKPPVGVDRGVKVAVACSDGRMKDREFMEPRMGWSTGSWCARDT
jgi:putative transposase